MLVDTMNQAEITREFFLDWEIVKERSEDRLLQLYERERRRNKIPKDEQFSRAYEIRSQRKNNWIFLFSKGLLGMGKCQSRNFAAQLAATTITALQYNLLSLAKRFTSYETIGGIFRDVQHSGMELSVTERIWGIILEMVKIMTGIFSIEEEEIFDAIINKSDNLAHFINFYELKSAS